MLTNGGVGDDTDARSCSLSIKLSKIPYTGLTQHPAVLCLADLIYQAGFQKYFFSDFFFFLDFFFLISYYSFLFI
jgi:hypothetical protein